MLFDCRHVLIITFVSLFFTFLFPFDSFLFRKHDRNNSSTTSNNNNNVDQSSPSPVTETVSSSLASSSSSCSSSSSGATMPAATSGETAQSTSNAAVTSNATTEATYANGDEITIKLKYLNDELKIVKARTNEPIGDFKKYTHFQTMITYND